MNRLSSVTTMIAVMVFTIVPYVSNLHGHYLGDPVDQVVPDNGQPILAQNVHHLDCHWLRGPGIVQAIMVPCSSPCEVVSFSPYVRTTDQPRLISARYYHATRAPPRSL
ncbi:MAG: hypothetical protein JSU61_03680 [Fidelibacterota bacterium]|nr:MAG: hypothetical protein JSU61_03680 [Candidatus Neomarinimicrobiota bacterium]